MPVIITPLIEDIRAKRAARNAPRTIVCSNLIRILVYESLYSCKHQNDGAIVAKRNVPIKKIRISER